MSKVFIVGSNSFSGASFVDALTLQGHEVLGCGRSPEPHPAFTPYKWTPRSGTFTFHQYDLNHDLDPLMDLIEREKPAYVVNFAAQSMVAESWKNPDQWFMTNVVSTVRFHDRLRHCKFLEKYVHVTTPEVYGSTSGSIDENAPFNPSTPYAVSRAAGDWHLKCLFDNYGFPVIFTRAANVYGPGQQLYRIIPRTILSALTGQKLPLHGGGKSIRSFIHIDDVSSALEAIMNHGENGDSYHISTDAITSIFDLVKTLANLLKIDVEELVKRGPERPGKDFAYQLSSEKIRTELGWTDKIDLNAGLADTLKWAELHLDELRKLPIDYEHKR